MLNKDIKKEIYRKSWRIINSMKNEIKENFQAPSIGVFIGHYNYPNVNAGLLSSFNYLKNFDGMDVMNILMERAKIVNSRKSLSVKKSFDKSKEIVLAEKPVQTEIFLKKLPTIKLNLSKFTRPILIHARLNKFKLVENPRIRHAVEKIIDDEMKAQDSIIKLYKYEDVDKISQILSAGIIGKDKKLVPTRWSITATDDILSKNLINKIKSYNEITEFRVFHIIYLGNEFIIILYPSSWGFEMIESWGAEPSIDYELYFGRKKYANNIEGAYYAARLAVAEYLSKIKKQASCTIMRLVHKEYFAPLGVWVIRNAVRKSFKQYLKFSNIKETLNFIGSNYPFSKTFIIKSHIIPNLLQRKLNKFY